MEKGEIAPEEQFFPLFTIFSYLMLDFYSKTRIRFSLRDKRLFEITEVEITRVDCTLIPLLPENTYLSMEYLVSSRIYTAEGETKKSYTMVCPPVREIIDSLKIVAFNHYLKQNHKKDFQGAEIIPCTFARKHKLQHGILRIEQDLH